MLSTLLPASLTRRLTLYYAFAFFVFLGASYLVLYWSIGAVLDNKMSEDLVEDVEEFSQIIDNSGVDGVISEMEKEVIGGEHQSVFMQLYRKGGQLVHSTDMAFWPDVQPDPTLIEEQFTKPGKNLITLNMQEQESITHVIYGAISPEYMLLIGESSEERDDIMALLAVAFALVFLITLPLASLLVWLLTRRSISGIKSVSRAALAIKAGNLNTRVNAVGEATEVQTLADTFDAMADRIQNLIHNMREMTDNIAHDLRSPISRVRLLCESSLRSTPSEEQFKQVATDSIAECDRLIKMINTSLDVAETEAGVALHSYSEVDMKELITDACELYETVAEEKTISLTVHHFDDCLVNGDVNGLQRMVANIIDNAVKYTEPGGDINVNLTSRGQTMELSVVDTGVGVDKKHFDNIFNRFYRIDPSRSSNGCGLGLSYARAVARAHDGDITVSSKVGRSTTFKVTLPSSVADAVSSKLVAV